MESCSQKSSEKNLVDSIYQILRNRIIKNELSAEKIVSIAALSQELNVSRTPVHNACQRLECEGFLTIMPKQGVFIKPITIMNARDTYELRVAIETYAFKKAFNNFTDDDILYLEETCKKQKQFLESNDMVAFLNSNTDFHRFIVSKYKNTQSLSIMDTLYARAFQIAFKLTSYGPRVQNSYLEHLQIIEFIRNKDLEGGLQAIENNIMNGYVCLTER